MPIEVTSPRWKELLSETFIGKGSRGGPLQVLDDVMPTFPVVDASEGEHHRARGEQLFAVAIDWSSGGVFIPQLRIRNHSPSDLVVIEALVWEMDVAGPAYFDLTVVDNNGTALANVPFVNLVKPMALDGRPNVSLAGFNQLRTPSLDALTVAAAAVPAQAKLWSIKYTVANTQVQFLDRSAPLILAPNQEAQLVARLALASTGTACLQGYIRRADPEELL